ncbi:thiamine pyrophosphate-dependent enzyme [Flagellimonas sp.]|jgi:2-oxoglutarate ferredoxin oxidoreductase subunit beta|uniref:thiamine pyrophosphate-dependent enzyme n=1 Tax=Flagellimonas sp. TaxID=2058762 RepID=UPI000B720C08|nr:MAG: 2-oxoglutarate oxidoreductase [Muricauda sp. TMED12]
MLVQTHELCSVPSFDHDYGMEDYGKGVARWCPGCGGHSILTTVQRVCKDMQYEPEKTVVVSGIGCSGRFPHYMGTYGFHGLHGRAFPVASGVKFRRPDLNVFVVTGDGDCCSIGAAHWVHAIRYNMKMVALLFDNGIYGLTKKQTSPTSPLGTHSNTHPRGSVLPPINPIQTTLGLANVSFVAQTVDWNATHLYATIRKAAEHPGLAFVRIVQRCPAFMRDLYGDIAVNPKNLILLSHENGINLKPKAREAFGRVIEHDPSNIHKAREHAEIHDGIPIGLLYQNTANARYDEYGAHNLGMGIEEKKQNLESLLDQYSTSNSVE